MDILFLSQYFYPSVFGGGEKVLFLYAKELVRRGHSVHVIAQMLKGTTRFEQIKGVNIYRVGKEIGYDGALPVSVTHNSDYIIKSTLKAFEILSKNNVDIIHCNTYLPALVGFFSSFSFKKPCLITFHDVYFNRGRNSFTNRMNSGHISIVGPFIEKLIMKLPNCIYQTVSETSALDLQRYKVPNVVVIPNGIDLNDFSYGADFAPKHRPYQIVFIGRLVFYKNLDTVIKSIKKVVKKYPEVQLIVIGDGPMRIPWTNLVKTLGLQKNIVFMGNISETEKNRILKESAFLVLPSVLEGFGVVILEAFACSKPVLASNMKPLTELVHNGENGFVVSPLDVDDWSCRIIDLLDNPSFSLNAGINGRLLLEQSYTISKVMDKMEILYRKMVTAYER